MKRKSVSVLVLVFLSFSLTAQSKFVESTVDFSSAYYKQVADSSENIFFSPSSIVILMGMAYESSNSNTAYEIRNVMNFPEDKKVLAQNISDFLYAVGNDCKVVNTVWLQQNYKILDSYTTNLEKYYKVTIQNVDFYNNPKNARKKINAYVKKETNNAIDNIIDQNLSSDTKLIMANVIYFKGNWQTSFDKKNTSKSKFYIGDENFVKVNMMNAKMKVNYYSDEVCRIVELPYADGNLAMYILLPYSYDLATLEESLVKYLSNICSFEYQMEKLKLSIPKFSLMSKYDLKPILTNMGIKDLFIKNRADLSCIDGVQNRLFVGFATHCAAIDVNEKGTEASAVSTGGGCFSGNTKVYGKKGAIEIKDLSSGMSVYTYNELENNWELDLIKNVYNREYDGEMVSITVDNEEIYATANHPFYVITGENLENRPHPRDVPLDQKFFSPAGRWVEAKDLKKGDILFGKEKNLEIGRIEVKNDKLKVYNLEMERNHNYLVGNQGILVHNKGSKEVPLDEFIVDHPFLFLIADKTSNNILFVGRIKNPK